MKKEEQQGNGKEETIVPAKEETVSRQKVKIATEFQQNPVKATQLGIKVERNVKRLQMEQNDPVFVDGSNKLRR